MGVAKVKRHIGVVVGVLWSSGCGPAIVVQGFASPELPTCFPDLDSPPQARAILDTAVANRYSGFIVARTAPGSTVTVDSIEANFSFRNDNEPGGLLSGLMDAPRGDDLECQDGLCVMDPAPIVGAVTTELAIDDDERRLMIAADFIPGALGTSLREGMSGLRGALDGVASVDALVSLVLIDSDGGRSLPAQMPLQVCHGCLVPDDDLCPRGATARPLFVDVCFPGQDIPTARCVCADGEPAPLDGCAD